jgi:carboxyl-terminal processing protease
MNIKNKLLTLLLAVVFGLGAAPTIFAPGAYAQESAEDAAPRPVNPAVYEKLDVFAHVLEKIRTSYVDQVTETEVIENAINGMLTSLDPHSSYLKPEDFEDLQQTTKGEFGGLGIEVTMDNGLVKVVSPIEDTPAAAAGLEPGDFIIRLDAKDVQGMTLKDAVDKMRGEPGSKIKLTVFRESEKRTFSVTVTRAVIKVKPVKSKLMGDGLGYLRITSFNDYTDNSLRDHLAQLQKANKGQPLAGVIIDLRNNPGGLLNQAIAVSDDFLQGGEIVSTRGRVESQNSRYNARPGDILNGKPIVVLINAGSASAAEIVAGALQDQRRAVLVGTRSFGKGSVQTIFTLPGGAGMRLTTARYYTPSGRSIQAQGIQPDILVKQPKDKKLAGLDDDDINPSEAALPNHLIHPKTTDVSGTMPRRADLPQSIFVEPKTVKSPSDTLVNLEGKPDYQLDRALSILKTLTGSSRAAQ